MSASQLASQETGANLSSNPFRVRRRVEPHSYLLFLASDHQRLFAADLKLVVQSPSGERVSGVQVTLYRASDNSGVGILTTTGDGFVTFSGLPNESYKATILAPGFAEQSLAGCRSADRTSKSWN